MNYNEIYKREKCPTIHNNRKKQNLKRDKLTNSLYFTTRTKQTYSMDFIF